MKKVVLIRHGQSTWNKENKFTGWTDVDLTEQGELEAVKAGELLKKEGFFFEKAYTSYLKRAIKTLNIVLDKMDLDWIPVEKTWRLNEKSYGELQGLNKAETAEKQVLIWRRSFDTAPAALKEDDPRAPHMDRRYDKVDRRDLPLTESLKDTVERILPYWKNEILKSLKDYNQIVVAAHGNSLRGIIMHLKDMSEEEVLKLNIPTGIPYVFEFDENLNVIRDYFLGNPEEIKKLMDAVANQAAKK